VLLIDGRSPAIFAYRQTVANLYAVRTYKHRTIVLSGHDHRRTAEYWKE
jgi:hypothetical protein